MENEINFDMLCITNDNTNKIKRQYVEKIISLHKKKSNKCKVT